MADEDDPYAQIAQGKISLKRDDSRKKNKMKKKHKKKDQEKFQLALKKEEIIEQRPASANRTKAEMAFQKMQEKNQTKRILEKACMTHKERVEKFNQHLDSLTEHFDIPKVSWTK